MKRHGTFSSPSSSTQSIQINFDEKKDDLTMDHSSNYNHHTTQSSMVRVENALHLGMFKMAKLCSSSCSFCCCCCRFDGDRSKQRGTHNKSEHSDSNLNVISDTSSSNGSNGTDQTGTLSITFQASSADNLCDL